MLNAIAIGFDFDGTLVDSQGAVRAALEETLPAFLHPDETWSINEVFHLNLDALKTKYRFRDATAFDAFRSRFVERFDSEHHKSVSLIDGAVDLLETLKHRFGSSHLFVLTNRRQESVRQIAASLGLDQYFAFIDSVRPDGTSNPKARALGAALARFPKPFWSAYVGDHENDADAAIQNGAVPILYQPSPNPENQHREALSIQALPDVIKIVETQL